MVSGCEPVTVTGMNYLFSASIDNIRLWKAAEAGEIDGNVKTRGGVQFKIIPGHHGGYVSQMRMWTPFSYLNVDRVN